MSSSPEIVTKRFRLAPITPDKVSDAWLAWTRDVQLMRQMNSRLLRLSRADLQRYVIAAQKRSRAIVGIYERAGGGHIGLYETELNSKHRNVTIDVLVDPQRYDLSAVLRETDAPLLAYMAQRFGMEKAMAKVVETYQPAIRHFEATHWLKEGVLRQEYPAIDGSRRLDVVQFGKLL